MRQEAGPVAVPVSAAAPCRIDGVLGTRQSARHAFDAVVEAILDLPSECRNERVVGIDDQLRLPRISRERLTPAPGDRVELAEAVELVTEEVAEQQHRGSELTHQPGHPELIDLEDADIA